MHFQVLSIQFRNEYLNIEIIMIVRNKWIGAVAFMSAFFVDTVVAQVGKPFIHDPSTLWSVKESIIHSVREEVG